MEVIWIIGLAILTLAMLTFYIWERKVVNVYKQSANSYEIQIKDLKNQVFHHKHHSEMHQKSFTESERKIKELGFSGVEDPQLMDIETLDAISNIRASLKEDAKIRFQEKEKARRDAELTEREEQRKIEKVKYEAEVARIKIIRSKEDATRTAWKYRNNGSFDTGPDGLMSFIPALGAVAYADSGSGGFDGSGGSYGGDDGGGSSSSGGDSGGGGGGGE